MIHAPQFAYPTDRADDFANEEENQLMDTLNNHKTNKMNKAFQFGGYV